MFDLDPATIISRVLTLVIAFTVHEFSHAFVATAYGDNTARSQGRLTLNPLSHLDFFGSVLLITLGFGWAKPVPINPDVLQKKSRYATMWVSVAGPLSNFLMAVIAAIPLRYGFVQNLPSSRYFPSVYSFLIDFLFINLLLMVFNLIPLAPLDGEKVLEAFVPSVLRNMFAKLRPYGSFILLALIFGLPRLGIDVFDMFLYPIVSSVFQILLGVSI
ncbi:MAG: site-2 protease family protein [Anaerolineaceae bacterium]|nr:site-2 protease family protein [Anaerolineaceae bacterium]